MTRKNLGFLLLSIVTLLVVYAQVISEVRIYPEFPMMYVWNEHFDASQWGRIYDPHHSQLMWYRPSSFILYHQVLSQLIDWHNILGWQIWGIASLLLLATGIYFLARRLFPNDGLTPILAAAFALIQPAFYMNVNYILSFDMMYQLCIVLAVGLLVSESKWGALLLVFFLYVLAITFKEQAITLPLFGGLYLAFVYLDKKTPDFFCAYRLKLLLVSLMLAVLVAYLWIRLPAMAPIKGLYHGSFNLRVILDNLTSGMLWSFHLFLKEPAAWGRGITFWIKDSFTHQSLANNLYGVLVLSTTVAYTLYTLFKDHTDRQAVVILWLFILVFLLVPVYSGGSPWHYALPVIGVSLICVRAWVRLLSPTAPIFLGILLLWLTVLAHANFAYELQRNTPMYLPNSNALLYPPIPAAQVNENTVILVNPQPYSDIWIYGAGHLFRFVYRQPKLLEVAVHSVAEINLSRYPGKQVWYAHFDWVTQRWQVKRLTGN